MDTWPGWSEPNKMNILPTDSTSQLPNSSTRQLSHSSTLQPVNSLTLQLFNSSTKRMNYLAHAYFSHNEPATMVGNLISDFIKGKKQFDYPIDIQKGIRLHRAIDTFTDAHPAVAEAKQVFRPQYRLYAGAFVDVSFDYFIANDRNLFATEDALEKFAQNAYVNMRQHAEWIPELARGYFDRMQQQNWLFNYRTVWGIQKSFGGIVYRSVHLTDSETAATLFEEHFFSLQRAYENFVPELMQMVESYR